MGLVVVEEGVLNRMDIASVFEASRLTFYNPDMTRFSGVDSSICELCQLPLELPWHFSSANPSVSEQSTLIVD